MYLLFPLHKSYVFLSEPTKFNQNPETYIIRLRKKNMKKINI